MTVDAAATASIAIIGASLRGTSLLERLRASAPELMPGRRLEVHIIDPHPPGSGRIWRAGQSRHLIMNTVAAQSTLFTDDTLTLEGPIAPGPNLAEWCRLVADDPEVAGHDAPPEVLAEARQTVPSSNPSRLLYGYYLRWGFARISAYAADGIDVRVHASRAVDVRSQGAGYEVVLADGRVIVANAVLLALGWLDRDDVPRHPRVIAPTNPIDQDLSPVGAGEVVAVRGLGMGFFDTLSQLTEGRGGRFVDLADGTCRYEASGDEPVLVAGSGRGIPYRAKPHFGAPPFFPEQRILRAAIAGLRAHAPVDFAADVLPLIERDAAYDYYRALDRVRPGAVREVTTLLRGLIEGEDVAALVAAHVPDASARLSLAQAADTWGGGAVGGGAVGGGAVGAGAVDQRVAAIVRADADQAALGMDSPLKLALHSYAAARGAVISLVEFGGLTSHSYASYRRYLSVAASFGSGPPLRRTRQLLAAHAAGIVRFAAHMRRVEPGDDHVRVVTSAGDVRADRLIEAWLPAPTVEHTADPLLASLVRRGLARAWCFADGTPSDALDIRPRDGALIGADGVAAGGLFSVGVPHEDVRVFTIIAPVPGTNSSVLRETDAAARAALRAAAAHVPVHTLAPTKGSQP